MHDKVLVEPLVGNMDSADFAATVWTQYGHSFGGGGPSEDIDAEVWVRFDNLLVPQAAVGNNRGSVPVGIQSRSRPVASKDMPDGNVVWEFLAGYRSADGPQDELRHFLLDVIPCESGWNPMAESPYGDGGLAQFKRGTWASVGGGDIHNPFDQGVAVARMLNGLKMDQDGNLVYIGHSRAGEWGCYHTGGW